MNNITRFPPKLQCPTCGSKLRPATRAEIRRGLQSSDATIRQAFAYAVQGDMSKEFVDSAKVPEWEEGETPAGTWVMLCEDCGHTHVHLQEGAASHEQY